MLLSQFPPLSLTTIFMFSLYFNLYILMCVFIYELNSNFPNRGKRSIIVGVSSFGKNGNVLNSGIGILSC